MDAETQSRVTRSLVERMQYDTVCTPKGKKWFARKDSNLDFQGQNLTCCHCTTGE